MRTANTNLISEVWFLLSLISTSLSLDSSNCLSSLSIFDVSLVLVCAKKEHRKRYSIYHKNSIKGKKRYGMYHKNSMEGRKEYSMYHKNSMEDRKGYIMHYKNSTEAEKCIPCITRIPWKTEKGISCITRIPRRQKSVYHVSQEFQGRQKRL